MTSKRYTHRVIRGFPINGVTYNRGELVSSDDWSWQGKIYVEARGWVEPLEPKVVAHYAQLVKQEEIEANIKAADEFVDVIAPTDAEIVEEVKAVRKATPVKKAVAPKKTPAKKPVASAEKHKKAASSPTKPVKQVAKKVAKKSPQK